MAPRSPAVSAMSALLLGLGLGLRHATDADHVVVVSALLQREPSKRQALRVATSWGLGHCVTFLGVGVLILLLDVRVPPAFELAAQLAVGAMMVALGAWHLRSAQRPHGPSPRAPSLSRPALAGSVHGLSGSAGIAILATTTFASPALALLYLGLFALGSLVGMVAFTLIMSWPLGWSARRGGNLQRYATYATAALSLLLGAAILLETALG